MRFLRLTIFWGSFSSWHLVRSEPEWSECPAVLPHIPSFGSGLVWFPPPGRPHKNGKTGTCPWTDALYTLNDTILSIINIDTECKNTNKCINNLVKLYSQIHIKGRVNSWQGLIKTALVLNGSRVVAWWEDGGRPTPWYHINPFLKFYLTPIPPHLFTSDDLSNNKSHDKLLETCCTL